MNIQTHTTEYGAQIKTIILNGVELQIYNLIIKYADNYPTKIEFSTQQGKLLVPSIQGFTVSVCGIEHENKFQVMSMSQFQITNMTEYSWQWDFKIVELVSLLNDINHQS